MPRVAPTSPPATRGIVVPLTHHFHIALEAAGHKLKRDEDGEVDIFALESGTHNGPECVLCGDSWCHHCGGTIEPCAKSGQNDQSLATAGAGHPKP